MRPTSRRVHARRAEGKPAACPPGAVFLMGRVAYFPCVPSSGQILQ
jgi:hypothetical protein